LETSVLLERMVNVVPQDSDLFKLKPISVLGLWMASFCERAIIIVDGFQNKNIVSKT